MLAPEHAPSYRFLRARAAISRLGARTLPLGATIAVEDKDILDPQTGERLPAATVAQLVELGMLEP